MRFNKDTILPILIALGGAMAVGSLHNATARGRIGVPIGYFFIASTLLFFIAGLAILWHYDGGTVGYRAAFGWTTYVAVIGIINIVTTLADPSAASMLFHEYLNPVASVLQLGKLLMERQSGVNT